MLLQADDLDRFVTAAEALHQQSPTPHGGDTGHVVAGGGRPDESGIPAEREPPGVLITKSISPSSMSRTGS